MIHVLNYSENIIDDLSFKQDAIYDANHTINIQDTMETFDFEVSSKIAQNLRDRHRLLIQDHMGIYREFIIESIVDLESGVTEVQSNASYLEDIRTAKPVKPHSFKDKPPTVMMDYLLADTGWEVSPETEVPMNADFSWDKVTDRLELLKELQDVFNMRLLFYVEVGKNNVEKRYVKLVEVNPIFNGEEIDYKENLIGLKREIDYSEVVTALLGVGPEDSETKKRIYVEVTDDKAQEQFGLPQRYIWDYYEVQVDSETEVNAGLIREETINELERRKKAVVTYDISSTDINAQVGDMIRVKDEDFNPEIYLEAEIVEIHYNLLNNIKEYKFGILKEFTREQVYSQYDKFRKELEERLKEIISNTDSIISERLEEELKYVERYIEKSPTPPLNPKEGDLWLDTTDPKVAILKRYENGKWVKSSVDHVSQIGGLTREETMHETLKERLYRIENSYFEAFKRHDALVTERHYHYVKDAIKNNLNIKLNGLKNSYDDFKIAFNNINSEQPTIGLITTAISKAVEFEAKLKEYNDSYYVARKEFDEVIAILQSQYSDEKFNEAMTEVAEAIGGTFDGTKIIADVPNKQELEDLNTSIKQYLNGEITALDGKLGKQIETTVNQAKNEFNVAIESVEKKVDGIEIGGRNLLAFSIGAVSEYGNSIMFGASTDTNLPEEVKSVTLSIWNPSHVGIHNIDGNLFYRDSENLLSQKTINVENFPKSKTFKLSIENANIESALFFISGVTLEQFKNAKFKLEIGTVATHWTPAPEDIENKVSNISQTVTKNSSSIGVLENQIALKVNSSEVTQQLNEALKPVKSDIQTNNAELLVQKGLIEQRVTKTDYTTDMNGVVKRLSTSEGKISTLEKEIKLKVTETDVQNKIDNLQIGGTNLNRDSNNFSNNVWTSYDKGPYTITENVSVDEWGAKDATQVYAGAGDRTSVLKIFKQITNSTHTVLGETYTVSIYVKNVRDVPMTMIVNGITAPPVDIAPNEAKRVVFIGKRTTSHLQLQFRSNGVNFYTEFIVWRTKVEKGSKPTDWTPAPEDLTNYTDSRVDGVQVGGRNLIPKSNFRTSSTPPPEWTAWGNSATGVYINQRTLNTRLLVQTANPPTNTSRDRFGLVSPYFTEWLIKGEEYILTWLASTSVNFEGFKYIYLMETDKGNIGIGAYGNLSEIEHNIRRPEEPNRVYTRYQYKFTSPLSGKAKILFGGWYPAETYTWFYFAEPSLIKGNKTKDWTPAPEDTDERIKTAEGAITVNSDSISQKVSYTEINKTNKTLERVISELIVDARGISYQYDVNGMIQGFTLNKDYFKLNHNLIDINNGDVVIQNGKTTIKDAFINNLAGNTAFINSLTAKSAFINTAKVTELISTDGRDSFTLAGGMMNWTRSTGQTMQLGIDGLYMKNSDGSIRFQVDRQMVTSAALGTSNSNVYLATDTGFEARVVDRNQLPGSGAINDYTYRPMRALIYRFPDVPIAYFTLYNGGEFRFTGETTGAGAVYQDVRANVFHGAGFRTTSTNLYLGTDNLVNIVNKGFVDGSTGSPIYRDLRANDIYNRAMITSSTHSYIGSDGELRVVNKGLSGIYRDVRAAGYYGTFLETTATNMYVRASGEVRFTANGTTGTYIPIRLKEWTATSHERYKREIADWNYSVLDIFKNDLKLKRFKFTDETGSIYDRFRHGIVIRTDSKLDEFPVEWRNGDGFDGNEVMWWTVKGVQELAHENDTLKDRINDLENKLNKIMEMIE